MTVEGFTISNKVYVPERIKPAGVFEERYIRLREKEKRIYTDETLKNLPDVEPTHVHYEEWQIRKRSAARLINYLSKKKAPARILEVGCGNGWLSRLLATIPRSRVIGTDINFTELQQAARVFGDVHNLLFIYGEIESGLLTSMEFDCVVLASCIQYFPSATDTINKLLRMLCPGGDIHIIDSPFYKRHEISIAKKRTGEYYEKMGFPEMSRHYYHHSLEDIAHLRPEMLYRPGGFSQMFAGKRNPFPWLRIKQSAIDT